MFSSRIKVGHNTVRVKALDGRRLYLDTSKIAFINTETNDDGDIVMITLEDKVTILIGDEFKLIVGYVNTVYEVNYIIVDEKGISVVIYAATPTKTELFLLPSLGKTRKELRHDSYFVSANLEWQNKFLCLTYRFTGTDEFKQFEKYMMTEPLYLSHLEYGKYQVTYIFKIPLKFEEDVVSFIGGKYSKFSKALITQIRRFHGADSTPMLDIINRNRQLKENMEDFLGVKLNDDAELASKPNMQIEIYKPYDKK